MNKSQTAAEHRKTERVNTIFLLRIFHRSFPSRLNSSLEWENVNKKKRRGKWENLCKFVDNFCRRRRRTIPKKKKECGKGKQNKKKKEWREESFRVQENLQTSSGEKKVFLMKNFPMPSNNWFISLEWCSRKRIYGDNFGWIFLHRDKFSLHRAQIPAQDYAWAHLRDRLQINYWKFFNVDRFRTLVERAAAAARKKAKIYWKFM